MSRQVRVPIRVRGSHDRSDERDIRKRGAVVESQPAVVERQPAATAEGNEAAPAMEHDEATFAKPERDEIEALQEDLEAWRERALRLQAEIENFRKRQRRLADDRIEADRGRLLQAFLTVADDLERALRAEPSGAESLREGVEMTHRSLRRVLKQEGAEPINAEGEVFDPVWHEAVGTVPHEQVGVDENTVVDVTHTGYRIDGRLLRPARVIVAK